MGAPGGEPRRIESQVDFLLPYLPPNAKALEIGCAAGLLPSALRRRHSFARYDGIELSPARAEAAKVVDHAFDVSLETLVSERRVEDGAYDVVISSHCLEHIQYLRAHVEAVKRVLSRHGTVFFEVPNRSGHPKLPFDDNRSHLHFFNVGSLSRLLSRSGLEAVFVQTGAVHDERYPDSIRLIARPFVPPSSTPTASLSESSLLRGADRVIVWGAGKMVDEVLAHFFDLSRIAYFVDNDPRKQGTKVHGVIVHSPQALDRERGCVIVINSLEFDAPIRREIETRYASCVGRIVLVRQLLATAT